MAKEFKKQKGRTSQVCIRWANYHNRMITCYRFGRRDLAQLVSKPLIPRGMLITHPLIA